MTDLSLADSLKSYAKRHPEEKPTLDRLQEFIAQIQRAKGNPFERSCLPGHFTGSAWLVDRTARERVLLMHHRKLDLWLQPGGHADGDTNLSRVALREAEEESGLHGLTLLSSDIFDLDIHLIPAGKDPEHWHFDLRFLVSCTTTEDIRPNHESKAMRWVRPEEVEALNRNEEMLRMLRKWIAFSHRTL